MIKVLLVEDDRSKRQQISELVVSEAGAESLTPCSDALTAKKLLRESKYDLAILDIALPDRPDSDVSEDGGIRLLDELYARDLYNAPDHIIGLSAYQDLAEKARDRFGLRSWSVVQFDPSSSGWREVLVDKIRYVVRARESAKKADSAFHTDLAVVCALDDPELTSVKALPWGWQVEALPLDHTVYYRGTFTAGGENRTVHAASSSRVGMTSACALAMKMIVSFRPRYLVMCGIAAGVGDVEIGDVVAAEVCWDYGHGKYRDTGEGTRFLPAPHQLQITPDVRSKVRALCSDHLLAARIREEWPGERPAAALRIHLGPMASGASVLADESKIAEITEQHRKVAAVEMEAYGIFVAADECSAPRPSVIVIKSVSDLGNRQKEDKYQRYASYTSARVLHQLATNCLY